VSTVDDSNDTTRRDALARNLCARLCDDRRRVADLEALDAVLTLFENEAPSDLDRMFANDRYLENEGDEGEQLRRRWFNLGMSHGHSLVRAERGLTELRRQVQWPDEVDTRLKDALIKGEG
jgi:hypothetical protein